MATTPPSCSLPVPGHERRNVHFKNTPVVHIITPQCTPPSNGEAPWPYADSDAATGPTPNATFPSGSPNSHTRIAGPYDRLADLLSSGGNDDPRPLPTPPPSWYERLKKAAKVLKREVLAVYYAMQHPATPWAAKAIAFLVLAYALSPLDLIPDFIPVLGILDDLVLLPLMIAAAIALIPKDVMQDARRRAEEEPLRLARNWPMAVLMAALWVACLEWLSYFLVMRYGTPVMRRYLPYGMAGLGAVCAAAFGVWLVWRVRKERKKRRKARAAVPAAAARASGDGKDADVEEGLAAAAAGADVTAGSEASSAAPSNIVGDSLTTPSATVAAPGGIARSRAAGGAAAAAGDGEDGGRGDGDELRRPLLGEDDCEWRDAAASNKV